MSALAGRRKGTGARDALIDTLRTTLRQARQELEKSRARAERATATEELVRGLRQEARAARARGDEERRAFAKREEAWSARCSELERRCASEGETATEQTRQRHELERRLRALAEELKRALDAHAGTERKLAAVAETRRQEGIALREQAVEALRGRGEVDERLSGLTLVAEQQRELLLAKDGLKGEAERARDALQAENLELRRVVVALEARRDEQAERERKHYAPLEAHERLRAAEDAQLARNRQLTDAARAADGLRDELTRLRGRLEAHDALQARSARLEADNRALAGRVAHLAQALERERSERAQWARARIDLLTQFTDAPAPLAGSPLGR